MTRALLALIAALGIALAGTGWWLSNVLESRGALRVSLSNALAANATLLSERDRAKRDAAAESERAQARQRERDGLAAAVAGLKQKLGDALGACPFTEEDAKAIDEFTRGR